MSLRALFRALERACEAGFHLKYEDNPPMKRRTLLCALAVVAGLAACSTPTPTPTDAQAPRDAARDVSASPDVAPSVDASTPEDASPEGSVPGEDVASPPMDTGPSCAAGEQVCAGGCVDTQNSNLHCGMCERACASTELCRAGSCVPAVTCMMGQTACGGGCVDTQTDATHCGMCGNACAMGQRCAAGRCVAERMCPMGEVDCAPTAPSMMCVNTQTSVTHCGGCGNACAAGESCVLGICQPPACPAGQSRCMTMGAASCVNLQTDNTNCGTCGTACPSGEACMAGVCRPTCVAPRALCTIAGTRVCINVQTDSSNCGTCGNVCTGGQTCQAGRCACATGRTACGTPATCVDTATDEANCGRCGTRCPAAQSCVAGACTCPRGQTLCGGICVSTSTDLANCGRCGNRCTAPATCSAGVCNSTCGAGTTACGGRCVALSTFETDNLNCGTCGNACGVGERCQTGVCRPVNDLRASATTITLNTGAEVTVRGSTTDATRDGPSVGCGCTFSGNVWYRFVVPAAGVVYFDTAGSAFDTSLFVTDSAGALVAAQPNNGLAQPGLCNDDAQCGSGGGFTSTLQSRIAAFFAAGTYNLAVGGCGTGAFTLHAQYVRADVARVFGVSRISGTGNTGNVTLTNAASAAAGTCGGTSGAENARWFVTCGGTADTQLFSVCRSDPDALFTRRTSILGSVLFDPVIYVRGALNGTQVACNDDGSGTGVDCRGVVPILAGTTLGTLDSLQRGARLTGLRTPRGLGVVFTDARGEPGAGMIYNMRYETE